MSIYDNFYHNTINYNQIQTCPYSDTLSNKLSPEEFYFYGDVCICKQGESIIISTRNENDPEKHLEALQKVIFNQNGIIKEEQYWYPYEVIELGANSLTKCHEREFTICTLLVAINVKNGTDTATDLENKLESHSNEYDQLPNELLELVINGFENAGC